MGVEKALEPTVEDKHTTATAGQSTEAGRQLALREQTLPAAVPVKKRRRWSRGVTIIGFLAAGGVAGGAAAFCWPLRVPPLPPGFAAGNGRLEADEIDIQTKFAGRILKLLTDEGDLVQGGQVLAVMDTRDFAAPLNAANA